MYIIEPSHTITPTTPLEKLGPLPEGSLLVNITHEFGLPWVTLEYNGKTEELEHAEALEWFQKHGAKDMDKVNEAINNALNFYHGTVVIAKPITVERRPGEPEIC